MAGQELLHKGRTQLFADSELFASPSRQQVSCQNHSRPSLRFGSPFSSSSWNGLQASRKKRLIESRCQTGLLRGFPSGSTLLPLIPLLCLPSESIFATVLSVESACWVEKRNLWLSWKHRRKCAKAWRTCQVVSPFNVWANSKTVMISAIPVVSYEMRQGSSPQSNRDIP